MKKQELFICAVCETHLSSDDMRPCVLCHRLVCTNCINDEYECRDCEKFFKQEVKDEKHNDAR